MLATVVGVAADVDVAGVTTVGKVSDGTLAAQIIVVVAVIVLVVAVGYFEAGDYACFVTSDTGHFASLRERMRTLSG